VTQDQHGRSTAGHQPPSATAAGFDQEFATVAGSSGLRRVWQAASPDLPQEIEPYSFVSVGLLGHVADALGLSPGTTLVDLGCGRGGPGLWLAQARGARLIGVDFSAVAVQQATDRAVLFGLASGPGSSSATWPLPAWPMARPTPWSPLTRCILPLTPRRRPERHGGCCGRVVGWC
jgi:hypothetical protein